MKLVFISDIHANLPALEAVWEGIQKHSPDTIFCLGDLVNFAGWDNEVIDFIRSHNIITIKGNHDEGIGNRNADFPFSYQTQTQKEFGILSIKIVQEKITDTNRNFLQTLPFSVVVTFKFTAQKIRLAMVHGSPRSNEDYVKDSTPDSVLLKMLNDINADILIMGHTHKPYHKSILSEEENRNIYKHVINAGSVGKPKHGNNKACYAVLNLGENSNLTDSNSIKVDFEYVNYNVEEVIEKIHSLGLGDAYDNFLKNGEGQILKI